MRDINLHIFTSIGLYNKVETCLVDTNKSGPPQAGPAMHGRDRRLPADPTPVNDSCAGASRSRAHRAHCKRTAR